MENQKRQQLEAVATNIAAATAVAAAIGMREPEAKSDRRCKEDQASCKTDDGENEGAGEEKDKAEASAGGSRRPHELLKVAHRHDAS